MRLGQDYSLWLMLCRRSRLRRILGKPRRSQLLRARRRAQQLAARSKVQKQARRSRDLRKVATKRSPQSHKQPSVFVQLLANCCLVTLGTFTMSASEPQYKYIGSALVLIY